MLKVLLGCLLCCVLGTSGLCAGPVGGDAIVDSGFADWLAEYYLPTVKVRVANIQLTPSNDEPGMDVALLLRNDGDLPAQLHGWSIVLTSGELVEVQAVRSIPVPTGMILGAGDTETIQFGIQQGMRFDGFQLVGAVAVDNVSVRTSAVQQILLDDEVSDALAGNGCGCTVWTWRADSEQWASEVHAEYDLTPPVIQCPDDLVVEAAPCSSGAVVVFDEPTATDNCSLPSLFHVSGPESGAFFEIGTHQETYVAIDESGNVAQESFTIDVRLTEDTTPPVISCPDDMVVNASSCDGGAIVEFDQPTATDDCSQPTLLHVSGQESGAFFEIGTYQETYVAIDEPGNVTQESFTIDVQPTPCQIVATIESIQQVAWASSWLDNPNWHLFILTNHGQDRLRPPWPDEFRIGSFDSLGASVALALAMVENDTACPDAGLMVLHVPVVGPCEERKTLLLDIVGYGVRTRPSEDAAWEITLRIERF